MVTLFRIDERLIHGQIAVKWTRHFGIDRIIVANDQAANNTLVQNTLKMAAPEQAKTAIVTIEKAISMLKDPRCDGHKILVLVDNPYDALTLVNAHEDLKTINVGNYGRIGKEEELRKRKVYSNNVYCSDKEVECFNELMNKGIHCYYQVVPDEQQIDMRNLLRGG